MTASALSPVVTSRTRSRSPPTAGATAVIHPGGSKGDDDVLQAAEERGMAVVLTGRRHLISVIDLLALIAGRSFGTDVPAPG